MQIDDLTLHRKSFFQTIFYFASIYIVVYVSEVQSLSAQFSNFRYIILKRNENVSNSDHIEFTFNHRTGPIAERMNKHSAEPNTAGTCGARKKSRKTAYKISLIELIKNQPNEMKSIILSNWIKLRDGKCKMTNGTTRYSQITYAAYEIEKKSDQLTITIYKIKSGKLHWMH